MLNFKIQSFRFGAEIAYVGATILHVGKNVRAILVGGQQQGKTAVSHRIQWLSTLAWIKHPSLAERAFI